MNKRQRKKQYKTECKDFQIKKAIAIVECITNGAIAACNTPELAPIIMECAKQQAKVIGWEQMPPMKKREVGGIIVGVKNNERPIDGIINIINRGATV